MLTMSWIMHDSVIFVIAAIFILALVWLLPIISCHQSAIKQRWRRFLLKPSMESMLLCLRLRHTFIQARFSPQGFLGLHFTLGVIVLIVVGLLFAVIAVNVVSGGTLTIIDANVAQWLHAHSTPVLTQYLLILTHIHDPIVISLIVVLIALYMTFKKRWRDVLVIVLIVEGGMLLNLLVKYAFQRARPSFETPLVMLTTYSFPSGHVAASTFFYGVLAALLISHNPSWSRATCIILVAFVMVIMVAFSRMYLGAHYLSDVLAAFLEGIAWIALCLTAIHSYLAYQETKKR